MADLLAGTRIWPVALTLPEAATVLTVVVGDVARQARAELEGAVVDRGELAKELGNLILSAARTAHDLGLDVDDCLARAERAQRAYAGELGRDDG